MLYHILKINILLYLILNWEYFPVPGEVNWVDLEAWDILLMLLKCEKYLNDCLTSKKYHNIDLEGKSGLTQSEFGLISTMQSIIWFTVWKSTVFSGSRKNSHRVSYVRGQSNRRHSVTSYRIQEIKYQKGLLSVYRKYKFSNYPVTESSFAHFYH